MVTRNQDEEKFMHKLAIVSGASQGLGLALAKALAARGADVVLVARREKLLVEAVEEVERYKLMDGQIIKYLVADLTSAPEAEGVVSLCGRPSPDFVFCCAGGCTAKLLLDTTSSELGSSVAINYNTALYLAHASMRAMAATGTTQHTRSIVFFSSVTHFYPFIGYGSYAPLKSALRTLADVMRQELLPYNVSVPVVFAGNFLSEGYEQENLTKPEITRKIEGPSEAIPADLCAEKVIRAMVRGQEMITTDTIGWFLSGLVLGASPRSNYLLTTLFGVLFAVFSPVFEWVVERDIKAFFRTRVDRSTAVLTQAATTESAGSQRSNESKESTLS
ncbi:3-ketosphinganine reductase [Myxozyma melibiosi]|uniref:3-ketodihydrosphingosine reductase TSC10 n=1 Tax=Myxozyma melibiosi TaxID=54550 RepID=A0ABR1F183_9ASCO